MKQSNSLTQRSSSSSKPLHSNRLVVRAQHSVPPAKPSGTFSHIACTAIDQHPCYCSLAVAYAYQRLQTVSWPFRTFVLQISLPTDAVVQQHSEQAAAISRRSAFLQLSSAALLGSVGLVLGCQGLLSPAQPAWAAGEPQELTGAVKAAVDKALDKFVVKSKVQSMACRLADSQGVFAVTQAVMVSFKACCSPV